jgi:uncharacterized protein (TIGR00645 family)
MHARINGLLRGILLTSRWSMAPLALGLIAALLVVLVQFFRELGHMLAGFVGMGDGEVMLAILKLVDLALIANLVIMIIGAAVEMLRPHGPVAPTIAEDHAAEMADIVEFGVIKLKLFASISAIAAIYLLERFINIHPVDKTDVFWELLILLTFVVSGILLAWMDRLTAERH